ncbi:hypothetical protein [Amphritea sp. HPY]|uniref:hypothetical protein n=1 Tax=Amphritea sp. HPY TaxID=3421652 RepID=UPI003D7D290D
MSDNSSGSVFRQLVEGKLFFLSFSMFLMKLDFKGFVLGVLYKLLAKVLIFISMILPIKIILFLAPAQEVPGILSQYFENKVQFVGLLCVLMLIFMVLSSLFSKLAVNVSKTKVDKIANISKKEFGVEAIEKIKKNVDICMLSHALFLFCLSCSITVYFIYPELLLVFFLVLVISAIFFMAVGRYEHSTLQRFNESPDKMLNGIAKLIFLTSFFYIVYDSIFNSSALELILMVVGLIMIRQSGLLISQLLLLMIKFNKISKPALKLLEVK